jgi:hypothetical protein
VESHAEQSGGFCNRSGLQRQEHRPRGCVRTREEVAICPADVICSARSLRLGKRSHLTDRQGSPHR